jgi:hypothetical protein
LSTALPGGGRLAATGGPKPLRRDPEVGVGVVEVLSTGSRLLTMSTEPWNSITTGQKTNLQF